MKTPAILTTVILTAALLLSGVPPTHAEAPSNKDDAAAIIAAQQHFDDGVAAYEDADYAQALEEFSQAYSQVPAAIFLYNAARVAQKLESLDESLKLAELARSQSDHPLPAPLIEKNTELIASLRQEIARVEAEEARYRAQKFAPKDLKPKQTQPKKTAPVESSEFAEKTHGGGSALGYSGTAIAAVGFGLLGAATYLSIDSTSKIDALSTVDDPAIYNHQLAKIEGQQAVGRGLLYSGIATVTIGGAMIVWDLISPTERAASKANQSQPVSITGISVSIAPDAAHAGVIFGGTY